MVNSLLVVLLIDLVYLVHNEAKRKRLEGIERLSNDDLDETGQMIRWWENQ